MCVSGTCTACASNADCNTNLTKFYGWCTSTTTNPGRCETACTQGAAVDSITPPPVTCQSNVCTAGLCVACTVDGDCPTKTTGTTKYHCGTENDSSGTAGICSQCTTYTDCSATYLGMCTNGNCSATCTTATQAANCESNYCTPMGATCQNKKPVTNSVAVCGPCLDDAGCNPGEVTGYSCSSSGMCEMNGDGSDSDNLGLILGLTIPIGVILIAVAGFCYWKKKQNDDDR